MCFRCVVKKFFEILKKKLQHDGKWYYYYDKEGNLIQKSPCKLHNEKNAQKWSLGVWQYTWNANGSLKSVKKPSGQTISFEYDALGRRTAKRSGNKEILYIWSGNVLLHEVFKTNDNKQVITWVYEQGSFVPTAKLIDGESFSIVSDYIGRPILAFDENGEKVWSAEYDIYGKLTNLQGDKAFIPFRQLGQYEDVETGLYYNRFRYYDCNTGTYVSQDPIGLAGGLSFYAYVHDVNGWVDVFGLSRIPKTGGTWDGIPGNSNWFSNNPKVIGITGGEGIPFKDGLPNFDKWSQGNFEIENMTGGKKDFDLVHQHLKDVGGLKSKAEAKKFLKNNGLTPHHHPDMKTIQLIPSDLHNNIPHEGGASKLRKKGHH